MDSHLIFPTFSQFQPTARMKKFSAAAQRARLRAALSPNPGTCFLGDWNPHPCGMYMEYTYICMYSIYIYVGKL